VEPAADQAAGFFMRRVTGIRLIFDRPHHPNLRSLGSLSSGVNHDSELCNTSLAFKSDANGHWYTNVSSPGFVSQPTSPKA
jgi:hypothetical protein